MLLQADQPEIVMIRKILLATFVSAVFGSIAVPADAATIVRIAPPPLRSEAIPEPRQGHVWVAGHWGWKNHRHQWIKGNWLRERRGYQYYPPIWVEREGRWHMQSGAWRRGDRDGDGIPNRMDRAPNNPNRY